MERLDVTILEREYSFACSPEGRETLLAAAQHVDRTMRKLREHSKTGTSAERIAIMAAVQLAAELLATPVGEGNEGEFALCDYKRKIEVLQQMVDGALQRYGNLAQAGADTASEGEQPEQAPLLPT
ncbi:MAG: cell division protein ZapA [Pigmentiphaga sp.]